MALRTVSNTGGNWNATTAWVGGVVPVAADTVDFTATSGNLVVNVTTAVLGGINFSNYVGTITFNANISVNTSVNLGTGGYTQAGSGAFGLLISASTTITSNGVSWNNLLTFTGNTQTYTLADNLNVTGNIVMSGTSSSTFTGNTLYIGGNLTFTTSVATLGTTEFVFNGTGTWSGTSSGAVRNNLTINTAGTLTLSGNIYYQTGTLTYISGTVVTAGSILNITQTTTFNTSGMTWNSVTITAGTQTLTSDLNCQNLTMASSSNVTINNSGGNVYILGNLLHTTANILLGTASINLIGTGTWSNASTGTIRNNLNINTLGTLTIGTNIYYNTGTLTYILGTVDTTTNNSTLNISTTTLNTSGMSWNNIVYTGGTTTITLSSNLVFIGTFTITGSSLTTITLAGVGIIDSPNGTLQLTVSGANLALTTSATHNILNYQFNASGFSVNSSGTWNVYGNLIRNGPSNGRSATGTINFVGTGSILFNGGSTGAFVGIWNINTSGTLTFGSVTFPNVYSECAIITYISGTVDASNCNLLMGFTVTLQTFTLNTSPINWKNITLRGANTLLLTSDLNLTGDLTTQIGAITINGLFNVNIGGNLNINFTTSGTATIVLNGTVNQTWSHGSVVNLSNNLTINKSSGTLTVSGNVYYQTGILTYIAGTVVSTGSVLNIVNSTTINTSGMTWRDVAVSTGTVTLTSDLNTEVLRMNGNGNAIVNNSSGNVYILESLIQAGAGILQGTASINLIGTGTWIHTTNGVIRNNLNINTSGVLTIAANIYYNTGTLTYIAGTVDTTTNNSTLNIGASTTLNTNGITWKNINPTATITLLSDLYFSGLFENSIAVGFTINGFNIYCMSGKLSGVGNSSQFGGNTTFIFKGNSTWFTIFSGFLFDINIIIDCDTLTLPINNTNQYAPFGAKTLTYLKGNMNKNSHLILNNPCTLLNFNKCIIDNIIVSTGAPLITMNEFFSGSPNKTVNLRHSVPSSTYTIAFQDGFEKIAKFVNISNCTLSKPLQLLVITKSKLNSRNTGIRYINQSPNGIAKGEPSVNVPMTFGAGGLLPDPINL